MMVIAIFGIFHNQGYAMFGYVIVLLTDLVVHSLMIAMLVGILCSWCLVCIIIIMYDCDDVGTAAITRNYIFKESCDCHGLHWICTLLFLVIREVRTVMVMTTSS